MRAPERRDALRQTLAACGVGSAVYYPTPIHRLAAFNTSADLPNTDRAASEVLSLPVHPGLSADDLHRIIAAVNA